jgi:tetratricopeptide (TPR) repeat protein
VRRALALAATGAALLFSAAPARSATPADCRSLDLHGHPRQSQACYESLTHESSPYLRAEGFWGLHQYEQANDEFRLAVARNNSNATYLVRWGLLLHERFNDAAAEQLFQKALQRDPNSAPAYLGLAYVSADGFDGKALEYVDKAIELDPGLADAHELAANLALEDSDTRDAIAQADQALHLDPDALDAMAVHAAVELLADRSPDAWLGKIRQIDPYYGEAYAIVAHQLVLHFRYEDAIAYYRKALTLDPRLWSARSRLGISLLRLGEDDEARRQLVMCYDNGYRNRSTVNALRLLDTDKNYVTYRDGDTILKLDKKEAVLLRPYVEDILQRAMATYQKKYQFKLPAPVLVQLYPNHEDFAVRTTGMPGLGAEGVTFGEVVAMDSPSARPPGSFNWASTLWHEMSHVYILTLTNHHVPRWFTEGLAVHEQTLAAPQLGVPAPITPDILAAIRDKKLLPVTVLDRGFVRPDYPAQVFVSYYQAGKICDYIQSRWGGAKLLDMAHSFAQLKTTAQTIQQNLGMSPQEFDKEFQAWLYARIGQEAANLDKWKSGMEALAKLAADHNYDAVLRQGPGVVRMYPQFVYAGNAYQLIAQAALANKENQVAANALAEYARQGGSDPGVLKQLATLEEGLEEPKLAAAALNQLNYIYPMDEDLHRRLGALWLAQGNYSGAIREFTAVVDMNPLDRASAEFDLAQAYFAAGQKDQAKNHVVQSLEAAPEYRPAQQLLLKIVGPN